MFPGRILTITFIAIWLVSPGRQRGQPGGMTFYVALDGDDRNPGTRQRPWRHIEWAMTRSTLRGGDTIRARGGVYRPILESDPRRDSVTDDTLIRPVVKGEPGSPITIMAEPGERVVLSGRFLASSWDALRGPSPVYFHQYATPLSFPFDHPFQVVEDGTLLFRVASLDAVDRPGVCFVDTEARRIYVWTSDSRPPADHLMEFGASTSAIEFRNGISDWRLSGFAITGFRSTGVLVAGGAGKIELDRMDISYIGAHRPGADLSSGHAVAVYDTSGGNRIQNNDLHHTLAEVIHVSQTGAGGDIYENNQIHDAGGPEWFYDGHNGRTLTGPGLILRGSGVIVRGNRFYANGYHGLTLESDLRGSEGPAAPSRNVIEGNVFALNAGNGLYGDGKNGLTASAGNTIRFNLFERNNRARAGSNGDAEVRLAGNWDDTLICNNTIYAELANGVMLLAGRVPSGTAQGADAIPDRTRLINNIVFQASLYPQTFALRTVDVPSDVASDYNNWYRASGSAALSWNGVDFSLLEEFHRRTGLEERGMSADPRFVSIETGHFWLRAVSPMIGRGLAEVAGSTDLGAFPYRPLLEAAPPKLKFVLLHGGSNPAPQTLTIRSAAGIPLGFALRGGGSWLNVSASVAQAPSTVPVAVKGSDLQVGSYSTSLQVFASVDGEPPLMVPITVTVRPAPPRRRQ